MSSWHDKVIERGVVLLLVFAPFAFAGTTAWAESFIQVVTFALFAVWLLKIGSRETIALQHVLIMALAAAFAVLVVFQILPLPSGVLGAVSPGSAAVYRSVFGARLGQLHPISIYPQETLNELLNVLAYLALFIVVVHHFGTRLRIWLLLRTVVITGCALVLFAVVQRVTWNGRLYWFYPIDPAYSGREMNIWGPYLNRNHFAGYLEMAIPLAMGMALYNIIRARAGGEQTHVARIAALVGHRKVGIIAGSFFAVTLLSGALFATLSRGAILACMVSSILFVLLARSRRSLRGKAAVLLLAGAIVFVIALFAGWSGIEARFGEIARDDGIKRVQVWSDLPCLVRDFPYFGTGLGTFDRAYPRYQAKYSTIFFEHAENDYLEVLSDTGAIGFALIMVLGIVFSITVFRGWKKRRNAFATSIGLGGIASCSAIAVHSLTDFNLRVPANALLFTVIAGLTLATTCRGKRDRRVQWEIGREDASIRGHGRTS